MSLLESQKRSALRSQVSGRATVPHSPRPSSVKNASSVSGYSSIFAMHEVIGVSTPAFRRMGAFAEYVTVLARIAYHLPD